MSLLVQDIVRMAVTQLEEAGVPDAKADAEILYCYMKRIDRSRFVMEWSSTADEKTMDIYFELVKERCTRVPIQYITGTQSFMGLDFKTDRGVLIPRQDTESVAERAASMFKAMKGDTVLDLCCGSGCIGIYMACALGAKVTAADISPEAVELTKKNASAHGAKMDVMCGDLFGPVAKKKYHMIVCNPPYIQSAVIDTLMPEVKDFEPREALDGGEDGLDIYRRLIEEAPEHLKKDGVIVLEIGHDENVHVQSMLLNTGRFDDIKSGRDLAGNDRFVTAVLAGKKKKKK